MSTAPEPAPAPAPASRRLLSKITFNPALAALVATWILVGWYLLPPIPHPHLFCWSPCPYCCPTLPPGPDPVPNPGPGPHPAPVTGQLHATLIYSAKDPAEALAVAPIRADPKIAEELAVLGCKWRTFDKTAPEVEAANLIGYYKSANGPAVIIQAEGTARPVVVMKNPSSAEVIAAIKRLKGR